jgi:hypothetical protein
MLQTKLVLNAGIMVVMFVIISYYCLSIKIMYPPFIIELFAEPFGRLMVYLFVYLISFYNELMGLLCLIPVVFIHLDIINLIQKA